MAAKAFFKKAGRTASRCWRLIFRKRKGLGSESAASSSTDISIPRTRGNMEQSSVYAKPQNPVTTSAPKPKGPEKSGVHEAKVKDTGKGGDKKSKKGKEKGDK